MVLEPPPPPSFHKTQKFPQISQGVSDEPTHLASHKDCQHGNPTQEASARVSAIEEESMILILTLRERFRLSENGVTRLLSFP